MARKLLDLGTGAITDGSQASISLSAADFAGNSRPIITVKGLAGAETLSWWVSAGDDWVTVVDAEGTQVSFTATYSADSFNGAGIFGITKTSTVAALEIWLHTGR